MDSKARQMLLIVDDEERFAELLHSAFVKEGFLVLQSSSGEDALNTALKNHPTAILLDVMLPGIDGLAVLSKLREDAWGKTVPVVLLTNISPDDRIIEKISKDEPSYYLVKIRSSINEIVEKVKAAIGP